MHHLSRVLFGPGMGFDLAVLTRGPLPLSLRFGVRLLFIRVVAPDQAAAYSECLGFLQRTYMVFLTFSATCRRRIAAASSFDGS